ncbi:unnamed protein product [Allacma fusca]|uniref:F-box domain-containing protein n=1 Tax=Allacma fusca TaxID=39272 RepID=A0A8J2KWJ0_9HEXA|nr:unnamed protein product [Allacma fusca]
MEQYEVEVSDFSVFPNEIVMKILSKLDTEVLEKTCCRVCSRWKEISETVIHKRLDKIRTIISDAAWKEINLRVPPKPNTVDLVRLKEFERTFISPKLEMRCTKIEPDVFIRRILKKRACDCEDIDVCITRVIHFMPCYKLILVQLPEQMYYYHELDPFMLFGDTEVEPYLTEAPAIKVDNNTHAAVR